MDFLSGREVGYGSRRVPRHKDVTSREHEAPGGTRAGAQDMDNKAPKTQWFKNIMACGTERHRLFLNGTETPFFIDVAQQIQHRSQGSKVGIYGSGLGDEVRRHDGSTYRIAGFFGGFDKIAVAKHRAEQMAMSA